MTEALQPVHADDSKTPRVIWRLLDGKPGHESQTAGLCTALKRNIDCDIIDISIRPWSHVLHALSIWPYHNKEKLKTPDLIVAAGHQTHSWLLLLAWRTRARSVVLMKPSLPLSWFDLCLIPEHDDVDITCENVITTQGALNAIEKKRDKNPVQTFIMIGGPSKRHGWNEEQLLKEVRSIVSSTPEKNYLITDSPRTPSNTSLELARLSKENCHYFPFQETQRDWFIQQLQNSGELWVTEDSISMIYESLTANGCVQILTTPRLREDKITTSLDKLYQEKYLLSYANWHQHELPLKITLDEAARCAAIIQSTVLEERIV